MRIKCRPSRRAGQGYALLLTVVFVSVFLLLLASLLQLTSTQSLLTERNNLFTAAVAAAEGATERVLAQMDRDYIQQRVNPDLSTYTGLIPSQTGWPVQFQFSNGADVMDQTGVYSLGASSYKVLESQFAGLMGWAEPYQIISTATVLNQPYTVAATVSQKFQMASIPVFQFAIFFNMDCEINPGDTMTIRGKVHANGNIYISPPGKLTFYDDVSAVGQIYKTRNPNDPQGNSDPKNVTFLAEHVTQVSSITMPIGTANNNPTNFSSAFLEPSPLGEDPNSPVSLQRLANRADLVVSNYNNTNITVFYQDPDNFSRLTLVTNDVIIGTNKYYSFVTNATFYDYREGKTVRATQIDVGKLNTWLAGPGSGFNSLKVFHAGVGINSVYVYTTNSSSPDLPAVRIVNGAQLPATGLTVASPQPLYVKGHFNLNNGDTTPGQTNTVNTAPAALMGDAVTLLSPTWSDTYAAGDNLNSRQASDTTVNAALLVGIVPSATVQGNKKYSGGVENFPRLLEDWNNNNLTYNGSMVAMFYSRYATNFWQEPGKYYKVPARLWAFDVNFRNQNRLPPLTPQAKKLVRGQWNVIANNSR